jgi:hypothetical protein
MQSFTARLCALLACACVALGLTAGSAAAATPTFGQPVPVTGTGQNGKQFTGVYTIQRFAQAGDHVVAVGVLTGKLKNRSVTRRMVKIPVSLADAAPTARSAQTTQPIQPTPGSCQVLNLVLGPLDLNLLGLRVRLNQVRLLIEAVPSGGATGGQAGGLLGDLLCSVTNLLAPSAASPLDAVTRLLNALLAFQAPLPTTR